VLIIIITKLIRGLCRLFYTMLWRTLLTACLLISGTGDRDVSIDDCVI
jgi:hypothetical protein